MELSSDRWPFRFNLARALEAVAHLLRRERHHRMNYMRLLKILYIADREALAESGKPLTGCHVLAMERGPVLEEVYQLIRGQHSGTSEWSRFFQQDRFHLEMVNDPGGSRLSNFAIEKLDEVAARYDQQDEWAMVQITHEFPEWIRNDPGNSSRRIPLVDILNAVGRGSDAEAIAQSAKRDASVAAFFASTDSND